MTFFLVFVAKALETILTTLRIILVSHHKKISGAILNLFISMIWIYSTITVVHNLNNEPYKIVGFCLGCFIGSYIGSLIEEKICIHNSMLICTTKSHNLILQLKQNNIKFTNINSNDDYILFITVNHQQKKLVNKLISSLDKNATTLNGRI